MAAAISSRRVPWLVVVVVVVATVARARPLPLRTRRFPTLRCPNGVAFPEAVYYINRDKDVDRHIEMREKLARARLIGVRVPAVEAPTIPRGQSLATIGHFSTNATRAFVSALLSQQRCAHLVKRSCSIQNVVRCCVGASLSTPNACWHMSAYDIRGNSTLRMSSQACATLAAVHLSNLRVVRMMAKHNQPCVPTAGAPCPHRFVLMLEDDVRPHEHWRARYCAFMRENPPDTWDIAKVESTRMRNKWTVTSRTSLGRCTRSKGGAGFSSSHELAPRFAYTASKVAVLRRMHSELAWHDLVRVPFAMGTAAMLINVDAIGKLLHLLDSSPVHTNDYLYREAHCTQQLRFAMSDHVIFNPVTRQQLTSTIGRRLSVAAESFLGDVGGLLSHYLWDSSSAPTRATQ